MKLRSLIKKVSFKSMFNELYRIFYKDTLSQDKVIETTISYHKMYENLETLPSHDNLGYKIYIGQSFGAEKEIDVCLLGESSNDLLPLHHLSLPELLDLKIHKTLKMRDTECMAYIFEAMMND